MINTVGISITGHVKIWDPNTKEVFVDKNNAINSESMSVIIANVLSNTSKSYIYEMHFGTGGCIIDETGNMTYNDVKLNLESGLLANLFSPTYYKVVDVNDINNKDPDLNYVKSEHINGLPYSDVIITCTLSESDLPSNSSNSKMFDEIGLKSYGPSGPDSGYLLSHIVFSPLRRDIEDVTNRVIQVVYTLRISV